MRENSDGPVGTRPTSPSRTWQNTRSQLTRDHARISSRASTTCCPSGQRTDLSTAPDRSHGRPPGPGLISVPPRQTRNTLVRRSGVAPLHPTEIASAMPTAGPEAEYCIFADHLHLQMHPSRLCLSRPPPAGTCAHPCLTLPGHISPPVPPPEEAHDLRHKRRSPRWSPAGFCVYAG